MKKIHYFMMLCVTAFTCHAGAGDDVKVERIKLSGMHQTPTATFQTKYSKDAQYQTFTWPMNMPVAVNKVQEDTNIVTVTCLPNCDDNYDSQSCRYTLIDSKRNRYEIDRYSDFITSVPRGTYDVIAHYLYGRSEFYHRCYVIHEEVEIKNDTTFSISPDEATVRIQFEPRMPNGEICYPETTVIYEDSSQETISDGNIGDLYYYTGICFNDGSYAVGINGNWANIWTGLVERDATHLSDIFINEVSDRFIFCCNMSFPKYKFDGSFYVVDFQVATCRDTVVANKAEDYVMMEKYFKQTPYGIGGSHGLQPGMGIESYYKQGVVYGVRMMANGYELEDNQPIRYYLCNNYETDNPTIYYIHPEVGDAPHPQMPDFESLRMTDMFVTLHNGELIHADFGLFSIGDGTYSIKPTQDAIGGVGYYHPFDEWNPQFSCPIVKMKTVSGNSCPILVPTMYSWLDEGGNSVKLLYLINHIGRNGENRESDLWASHTVVKVDDEIVAEEEGYFSYNWTKNSESQGLVGITVTNENVDVDGLSGKNVTSIHFNMAGEDNTAPTLQMLDFRDQDDNAIDRFDTAVEGKLQFYCGDFNERYTDDVYHTQYFVCNDLTSVEVAYSPYQADTWTALDATEVAEYYYDSMGHYYAAPLASVTGEAYEGWFDLKVKVTDAAGNWQEQVISPAFRIDNLAYSSIANVEPNSNNSDNAIYNLAGQRMRGDLDALPRGIYIVGGKKVVK